MGEGTRHRLSEQDGRQIEPQMCVKSRVLKLKKGFQKKRHPEERVGSLYDATLHHIERSANTDRVRSCVILTM